MSKSTTVNKYGFTPYANGRCQMSMSSNPLLMVDVKVYYSHQECVHTLCLMVDVKVYYSHQEWVQTLCLMVDVKVYYSQRVWVHTLC